MKELSTQRSGRRIKDIKRIRLVRKIVDIMMGKTTIQKYLDLGSPIVKIHINGTKIPNMLIDLGAAINIMSKQVMHTFRLPNLKYTPTLLLFVDRSVIKPDGVLEDVCASLYSWEYPVDFMVLTPKNNLGGHPLILVRPWLAITDTFIDCRSGDMFISNGNSTKKFTLYPLARTTIGIETKEWIEHGEDIQPIFVTEQVKEEDQILNLLENNESSSHYEHSQNEYHSSKQVSLLYMEKFGNSSIEIFLGKTLNVNENLEEMQKNQLIEILQKHSSTFAWEYTNMRGIDPKTCIHHIYIEQNASLVRQPQRRMNPNIKYIIKEELQKLLNVNFIYPIFEIQWVSPLVIVPKKNGKWRVCIDYRELKKETLKYHFPLPFIDQVLDTLVGKRYFSFLDGFSGYNQIQVGHKDQDKNIFTCPWGTYAYQLLPFGFCNAPATLQRPVLDIFSDIH